MRTQHIMVLESMARFPVGATAKNIQDGTVHRTKHHWSPQRIFAVLDQLQTEGLVERLRLWPSAGGGIVWLLTQKGMQCLTEAHH